jgi:hypothetical protein
MGALGIVPVFQFNPRGSRSLLNITAATLVKSTPGTLMKALVSVAGTTGGALTLNDANVLITAQTITAITQAASAVVTISTGGSSNPFAVGNTIAFASVVGMTQINGLAGLVTAIGGVTTAWTITVNINSTNFTAYSSAGTAASFGAGNQILSVPFGSLTAGQVIAPEFPCLNGILVSGVPTGGSPVYAISYN